MCVCDSLEDAVIRTVHYSSKKKYQGTRWFKMMIAGNECARALVYKLRVRTLIKITFFTYYTSFNLLVISPKSYASLLADKTVCKPLELEDICLNCFVPAPPADGERHCTFHFVWWQQFQVFAIRRKFSLH